MSQQYSHLTAKPRIIHVVEYAIAVHDGLAWTVLLSAGTSAERATHSALASWPWQAYALDVRRAVPMAETDAACPELGHPVHGRAS